MHNRKLWFCLAAILFLALAGRAEAACESEHRVSDENSACMREQTSIGSSSFWYRVYNECYHEIRVKFDIQNGSDITKDVPAHADRYGLISGTMNLAWRQSLRSISRCSDFSSCNHQ